MLRRRSGYLPDGFYRWRKPLDETNQGQLYRLKQLEKYNLRLQMAG